MVCRTSCGVSTFQNLEDELSARTLEAVGVSLMAFNILFSQYFFAVSRIEQNLDRT